MIGEEMQAYLGLFLEEAREKLQILDDEILELEKDITNKQVIDEIFRAAHTLKGSSGALGYKNMNKLTHTLENVFDAIRSNRLTLQTEAFDVIFTVLDHLKILVDTIEEAHHDQVDVESSIAALNDILKNTTGENNKIVKQEAEKEVLPIVLKYNEVEKMLIEAAFHQEKSVYAVFVELADTALLQSVRALLVYNNLEEAGEIIATTPSVEEIEAENNFSGNFVYTVISDRLKKEIFEIVNSISEIKTISVIKITEQNLSVYTAGRSIEKRVIPPNAEIPEKAEHTKVHQTIRVDVKRLDGLMNLVGELIIDRSRLEAVHTHLHERYEEDVSIQQLNDVNDHIARIVSELQEDIMRMRMFSIEQLFSKFPRMVRDIIKKSQKKIDFVMEGKETELDRTIIEEIGDPITHLLRNSLDHGIESPEERISLGKPEQGTVLLKASQEDNHIVIQIKDDGKGIDANAVKAKALEKGTVSAEQLASMSEKEICMLIFQSGLSTAKQVTDISGRGVGLDIVKTNISRLGGMIDLETEVGKGTAFSIKLPLTLAILTALLVRIGNRPFALPLVNVVEIVRIKKTDIRAINHLDVAVIREQIIPLVHMHEELSVERPDTERSYVQIVILGLAEKRVGLVIDETYGNQEIVIKSLGAYLGNPDYIAGATILGNGQVSMILDAAKIVQTKGAQIEDMAHKGTVAAKLQKEILSFKMDDGIYALDAGHVHEVIRVPNISPVLGVSHVIKGIISYRDTIIPIVDIRAKLRLAEKELQRSSRVIVMNHPKHKYIGILVDEIEAVLFIDPDKMEKAPDNMNTANEIFITGIYRNEEQFITMLDHQRIKDTGEMDILSPQIEELMK